MAGKKGRSGGANKLPPAFHVIRGTYRASRHATAPAVAPAVSTPPPRLPSHLSPAMRRWWRDVVTRWQLDTHHVRLLTLAAQAWDDCQAARDELRAHGSATITMPSGAKRPHPAVRRELDARQSFARLIEQLNLEAER